ncbi:hypothetical protein EsDP_00006135 [Epichloe bromicola]|uniref:DNA excision repair protein ERCC-8 n=1 Tax=Epichloe bromicola TaxID=79588 RepID=A0ABQ0CWQ4_9HYPO
MQARLLARETGDLTPDDLSRSITSQLLRAFAPAPQHRFHGQVAQTRDVRAHGAGASGLALDKFDGRLLVSGGSEGSIKIWDLDEPATPHQRHTFRPVSTIGRDGGGHGHSHGITHLAFYPFDADAFLSSSYDKTLRLWATRRAALTAVFDLNATIYSHAMSPIAGHLLVSCATQHSSVRLVDLKSGSAVQALVSHGGPVLCTAWSPRHEHVLASGHADGRVRIWDIRRAGGVVAQLDQEDSLGIVHRFRHAEAPAAGGGGGGGGDRGRQPRFRAAARAHDEAVNGLAWTDDGAYMVSAGLDRKVRVWDAATGANTLASFGALIQNQHAKTAAMVVTPPGLSSGRELLVWPNDREILMLDLHDGNVVTRLRSPGAANPLTVGRPQGRHNNNSSSSNSRRITTIVWRGNGGGSGQTGMAMGGDNSVGAIYSAHLDGQIRAWMPQIPGPDDVDEAVEVDEDDEAKTRKRKAVDSAYRSLMGRQMTFTGP